MTDLALYLIVTGVVSTVTAFGGLIVGFWLGQRHAREEMHDQVPEFGEAIATLREAERSLELPERERVADARERVQALQAEIREMVRR